MSGSSAVQKDRQQEILGEIDAFVDTSIAGMDTDQLTRFNRKSEKIMKDSNRRMKKAAEIRESDQLRLGVPRA
jgi:hypothetical protein